MTRVGRLTGGIRELGVRAGGVALGYPDRGAAEATR